MSWVVIKSGASEGEMTYRCEPKILNRNGEPIIQILGKTYHSRQMLHYQPDKLLLCPSCLTTPYTKKRMDKTRCESGRFPLIEAGRAIRSYACRYCARPVTLRPSKCRHPRVLYLRHEIHLDFICYQHLTPMGLLIAIFIL